jgi:predicted AlkP superfamily pyrophosphatase or phosphodiesterase
VLRKVLWVLMLVSGAALGAERPRLGVMIVVDQLSAEAFRARLPQATGGFKRLTQEGLTFHELRYEAAPTLTSVGHATLATGAWGELHGIASNDWLDAATGRPCLSTEDERFTTLGRTAKGRAGTAPTFLRVPTLADAVKAHHGAAKAVSISAKERSAILTAGRAGLAVWLDADDPFFTSSTFYVQEVPAWVKPVNERLAKRMQDSAPSPGSQPAEEPEPVVERAEVQQWLDSAEVDLAIEAVKALELGRDEVPDLLTVSFSGHDRLGHAFGPDAPQALSDFFHVDRELGRLLAALDAQVGKGRYVVALTADHGAAPLPEVAKARGLDAGRIDVKGLRARLEAELDSTLGPADWLAGYRAPGYTFTAAQRAKAMKAFERLRAVAQAWPGVLDLFASWQLPEGALGDLYRRGLVPGHSPDLIVVAKPYWTYGLQDRTGHASPWLYDRAVPLVLWGPGVHRGEAGDAVAIDVAPTLARLLGVPTPAGAQGHAIGEVFR